MGTTTSGLLVAPAVPQPENAGDIVGLLLQNDQSTALPQQYITFGQVFQDGQVPATGSLDALVNDQKIPVQMDVKTSYPDGSVETAVLTMLQPALAPNSSTGVMLALGSGGTTQSPINLSSLNDSNYNVTISLDLQNPDGTTTAYNLDAATLLQQALQAGTVSYWLQGPQATQAQIDVPIAGSLHVTLDITEYADGSTSTDIEFNNDDAMQAVGGTATYNVTIAQNGNTVLQQNDITQYQYTTWNQMVYSNGAPQVNIQRDVNYLEQTGAIPNYDLTAGVSSALIATEVGEMGGSTYGILGSASVTQYMPTTGGRADVGLQPQWNTAWLVTQNQSAEQFALAQANAAGSVPWHFFDPTTGTWITLTQYPDLWTDSRGGPYSYTTGLTQQVNQTNSGWTPDTAHQPDLAFVAYLMTGNQEYLDQLNAQADFSELDFWPASSARNSGQGIVADAQNQVRGAAWSLREIDEAAYANPDGSAMKAYFTQLENNNFQYLLSQIPTWTTQEGQAYGYLPSVYYGSNLPPWEQDYFASTVVQAAEMGNQDAVQVLQWESNFLVGRFLNSANGFDPNDGIAYNLVTLDPSTNAPYTTWAEIEQATEAAGLSNGSGWAQSNGDYGQLALQSLAGIITVLGDPQAIKAYGWLLGSGAPYISEADFQNDPTYNIVPRLSDGNSLSWNNITISNDYTATTIEGSSTADQLIEETGSGNVTIIGGSGINLLFAGSGNDLLIGGSNDDYIYAGSGSDTIYGGAGTNYLDAGTGPTTFLLDSQDQAQDTIADFQIGTDALAITDVSGQPFSAAEIQAVIASATQDAAGDAVLQLSPSHAVTLDGISLSSLVPALFGQAGTITLPGTITPPGTITDPGPTAGDGSITEGHGQTVDLTALVNGLITPGLPGDTETLTGVSAAQGNAVLGPDNSVTYAVPASGSDTISYTVADEYGDTATGQVAVTVDPGPTAGDGSITEGHGQTVDLTALVNGLITPGLPGDTETLTGVSAAQGNAVLGPDNSVTYAVPASGSDTISYTVADEYGDTATGQVAVTVDPGPTAGDGSITEGHGQTVDLTALVNGLITPGLPGDTETLTAVSAAQGNAVLGPDNSVTYTVPASGSDTIGYTVVDEYGDTATGQVAVTVASRVTGATGPVPLVRSFTGGTFTVRGSTLDITGAMTGGTITLDNAELIVARAVRGSIVYGTGTDRVEIGSIARGNNNISLLGLNGGDSIAESNIPFTRAEWRNDTLILQEGTTTVAKFTDVTLNPASTSTTFDAWTEIIGGETYYVASLDPPTGSANVSSDSPGQTVLTSEPGDTVVAGAGAETVFAGHGVLAYGGPVGAQTTFISGGSDTVVGGAGSMLVFGGASSPDLVFGGAGHTEYIGGAGGGTYVGEEGSDVVYAGAGGETIYGSSGGGLYFGAPGNDAIVAGAGASTVVAANGNTVFLAGAANNLVIAGSANETLLGSQSAGNDTFLAGSGVDQIIGGPGQDVFIVGIGSATMTGGTGADLYAFFNGQAGGIDVITNFKVGTDHVTLQNYGPAAVTAALQTASVSSGSTTITLPDGTWVTFQGVTHLTSSSFV